MTQPPGALETRHCIKCGREIGPDETMCPACNRAGMATPSATQYHGTIAVAIVIAVIAMAWAAGAALDGVGPYQAEVRGVRAADVGYDIAYAITNEGTKAGRAKCQLTALDDAGRRLRSANALSPQVHGGETVEASISIPGLDEQPADVTVSCS